MKVIIRIAIYLCKIIRIFPFFTGNDFCYTLHIMDSSGASVVVNKKCANSSECWSSNIGCLKIDTQMVSHLDEWILKSYSFRALNLDYDVGLSASLYIFFSFHSPGTRKDFSTIYIKNILSKKAKEFTSFLQIAIGYSKFNFVIRLLYKNKITKIHGQFTFRFVFLVVMKYTAMLPCRWISLMRSYRLNAWWKKM